MYTKESIIFGVNSVDFSVSGKSVVMYTLRICYKEPNALVFYSI